MPSDDLDRNKMYTAGADDMAVDNRDDSDDDDGELELEPPDPDVIASEERRAAAAINVHKKAIDVNEVYRDLDANRDTEIVEEWLARARSFRYQFQIKHLLILTAVVAVLLMLHEWIGIGKVFLLGFAAAVIGISIYLKLEENKRHEAAARRRRKMYAERRAAQATANGVPIEADKFDDESDEDSDNATPSQGMYGEADSTSAPAPSFRFQFSMGQMLAVVTIASIVLGLGGAFGGLSGLATICGLVALAGIAIPLLGLEVPPMVVFGWWIMLVLYITLSLLTAIFPSLRGG
jgi:hypothetical protein